MSGAQHYAGPNDWSNQAPNDYPARFDFDTLRGALRRAGVTEQEISGNRMDEIVLKLVEILTKEKP